MVAVIVSWAACFLVHLPRCMWRWHKFALTQQPPDAEAVAPSEIPINDDIAEDDVDDGDSFVTCPCDYYDTCKYFEEL